MYMISKPLLQYSIMSNNFILFFVDLGVLVLKTEMNQACKYDNNWQQQHKYEMNEIHAMKKLSHDWVLSGWNWDVRVIKMEYDIRYISEIFFLDNFWCQIK